MTSPPLNTDSYRAQRITRLGVAANTRDVRVVHELDGILDPVRPDRLLAAGQALWDSWLACPLHPAPNLVLGLDAGGIPPTVAVALASGLPYRLAWKLDLDLPDKRVFHEPHANRPEVYSYGDLAGTRVLVVDDEVTSGRTLANLVGVLREAAVEVVGVACLVEDTAEAGRELLEELEVPLCALTTL